MPLIMSIFIFLTVQLSFNNRQFTKWQKRHFAFLFYNMISKYFPVKDRMLTEHFAAFKKQ